MRNLPMLRRLSSQERRMAPRDPKFIGEVPIIKMGNGDEGAVVATGKVEDLNGKKIVHIDMAGLSADILRRGFSMGEFSPGKEK